MSGIMQMMYGSGGRLKAYITIASDSLDYILDPSKIPGYQLGNTEVIFTINSGIYLGSSSNSIAALRVTGWSVSDSISIINNGFIVGKGGDGGNGFGNYSGSSLNGQSGGPGLSITSGSIIVNRSVSVTNNGTIAGGGGGGAGGAGTYLSYSGTTYYGGGGGGGGAGYNPGLGGVGGGTSGYGTNGNIGTRTSPGNGGTGYNFTTSNLAGTGGLLGAPGQNSSFDTGSLPMWGNAGIPGSGGNAVIGNDRIDWLVTGTRLGNISS